METIASFARLAPAIALLAAGCAAEVGADGESSPLSAGNCAYVPDCIEQLTATDGPVSATVTTFLDDEGNERQRLSVRYTEPFDSSFLLCRRFPYQPPVSLVFVVGPEHARSSVTQPMDVWCTRAYGDNGALTNSAYFSLEQDEDPELWDTLFPPHADGSRWYAIQVALGNAEGGWDSRYGHNYRLVLEAR